MNRSAETMFWVGDGCGFLSLLDQTKLPSHVERVECKSVETVWEAIKRLRVRGAPAIGIAAAYGVVLSVQTVVQQGGSLKAAFISVQKAADYLATSRPTAVNLFWALERMQSVATSVPVDATPQQLAEALLHEAQAIHEEDRESCKQIGVQGVKLLAALPEGAGILTHCNAGALATGGDGTALSVLFALHETGKKIHVYADETRPLLQGARLTTWELLQRNISTTLICDSMAAHVMREGRIQAVITGADRIAASGDSANKIGTYGLAIAAAAHDIPFYIAAPASTFDLSLASGEAIPIEERDSTEVKQYAGVQAAPEGISVYNPAFDVTPSRLIRAIITDKGVISPVNTKQVSAVVES